METSTLLLDLFEYHSVIWGLERLFPINAAVDRDNAFAPPSRQFSPP